MENAENDLIVQFWHARNRASSVHDILRPSSNAFNGATIGPRQVRSWFTKRYPKFFGIRANIEGLPQGMDHHLVDKYFDRLWNVQAWVK